jgi:hypothetical protein
MIPNALKQLWSRGKPTINGWCSIGSPFTVEITAAQRYDSITIDVHGALDYSSALPMLHAMHASGVVPMVRVPWMEPGIIMKVLDAGAYGAICPMVNNARQAAEFVSYMRYPPLDQRSFGPTRVSFAAGADYGVEGQQGNAGLRADRNRGGHGKSVIYRRNARSRRTLCRSRRSHLGLAHLARLAAGSEWKSVLSIRSSLSTVGLKGLSNRHLRWRMDSPGQTSFQSTCRRPRDRCWERKSSRS